MKLDCFVHNLLRKAFVASSLFSLPFSRTEIQRVLKKGFIQ